MQLAMSNSNAQTKSASKTSTRHRRQPVTFDGWRSSSRPQRYAKDSFLPTHDPKLPRVLAEHRLLDWLPHAQAIVTDTAGRLIPLSHELHDRAREATFLSYAPATWKTYGSGLADFIQFCIQNHIPEHSRVPLSLELARVWIAARVGVIGESAMKSYVHAVHAWESINGYSNAFDTHDLQRLFRSVAKHAPVKRRLRAPIRITLLERIHLTLDFTSHFDIAFSACLKTTYWATARLGETTLATQGCFDPRYHLTPNQVVEETSPDGHEVTIFRLPWTKVSANGEDVYWAKQHGDSDPKAALALHLRSNNPPHDGPLFAYRIGDSRWTPMTGVRFRDKLKSVCDELGVPQQHGHGLRIGNTLELLLRGLSFEAVKAKGRWSGDSFKQYLRDHAMILAPYIQADPVFRGRIQEYVPDITR
jgi:hypothetical protein